MRRDKPETPRQHDLCANPNCKICGATLKPEISGNDVADEIEREEADRRSFDAELARQAFDVMVRRRWSAVPSADQWYVPFVLRAMTKEQYQNGGADALYHADPFTALVEADRWYREHVERKDGG